MRRWGVSPEQMVSSAEMERIMKVQEVILKAMAGSLKWWEADEIIGVTDRTMRRWREELGIKMIPAYSPRARGRMERSYRTWQGRLPQELRLRQIGSVEDANQFLRSEYIAEFNRRFAVV